jgi:membrane-associated protein
MNLFKLFIDMILHLDVWLPAIVNAVGIWTYLLLFFVIFIETGLVVTPFLPGDSLLFAAGAVASAATNLDLKLLFIIMPIAAIAGDSVNYSIGHFVGPRVFSGKVKFLKMEYVERTQEFFKKYGGKTILLARFIPIVRTYAPFMAGVGKMPYTYFLTYNVIGGILWTAAFISAGYFFGSLKFIADRFSLVIIVIVVISFIPAVIEYLKARKKTQPSIK